MPHTFFLVPSGHSVGLTSVALGLVHVLDTRGIRVAFFKPIGQPPANDTGPERSTHFVAQTTSLRPLAPIPLDEAARAIAAKRADELLERVVGNFQVAAADADVVIVEGLVHASDASLAVELNRRLIKTLSAEVIVVSSVGNDGVAALNARLELTVEQYGGAEQGHVIGCVINRVPGSTTSEASQTLSQQISLIGRHGFQLIGAIPENAELSAYRMLDVARHLNAKRLHTGDDSRRVRRCTLLASNVANVTTALLPGALLITPSDRADIVVAVALAAINNTPIAGLLVSDGGELTVPVLELCAPAFATGLPVLSVPGTSWEIASELMTMSAEVPADDVERARTSMNYVAQHLDVEWLLARSAAPIEARMSPAAFCFRLVEVASRKPMRIVLPEGAEPRTIRAAVECTRRKIARCLLLGDPKEIRKLAEGEQIALPDDLEIAMPAEIRQKYIAPLVEMRKHKGVTEREAAEMLEDNVWLGTMMLALGEVNGLVSGALHSTANTIRPALQIIKTKPGASLVSSVFFMCLPDQVVVYGDCAVNPDPDATMLADIAIQSADSAARFGIAPRVAMISYSTGESGAGKDVDKVHEAARLAHERRPELPLDGPMQYDAAANAEVAANKAPGSPVAGRATVFVFPDLNTGNTTYKAVQRTANVVSIGPMLQGLNKPVNDLSRGASVEDIVYTIAITAIQAMDEPA